jgi:fructokinase
MTDLFAGIEAGGTKWLCMVATHPKEIRASTRFATTQPQETIKKAIAFIQNQIQTGELKGLGIGSFGPLDLNPKSPTYGFITSTPKPGWANIDLINPFRKAFDLPIGFDTDVNAAALGEARWGAAQGLTDFVYLTIGTGIGGAGMVNGELIHGLVHPEIGHVRIPHDKEKDPFPGVCPYHGDCLEGLATGPAIEARWRKRGEELPPEHPAWLLEAHYLALGVANLIFTLSPQRVILGGGVMEQAQLFPLIRKYVQNILNDYIAATEILEDMEGYIVPPGLGSKTGVLGAIALAQRAAERNTD